ncbi:MAG: hypothetical protein HY930_06790 [Euryarchaeota archaeon]|nr:hypothetical protein [Euryarchaeota archaeon]
MPLTQVEIATLIALFSATKGSVHSHVPIEAITARVRKDQRGIIKKTVKRLVRRGLAIEHPTGGGMTYHISTEGINIAREYLRSTSSSF